jgi:hypothetical protein
LVTACGGSSPGAVTAPAEQTPSLATESAPSTAATAPQSLLPVEPAPDSPALKAFDKQTVGQAMRLARDVTYIGMTDTTLLTPKATQPIADYASITGYMTPEALRIFEGSFAASQGGGNKEAEDSVTALAFTGSTAADRTFRSDVPITLKRTRFSMDPLIDVDASQPDRPRIVVTGTIETGYVGRAGAEHGVLRCDRNWTYHFVPAMDTDRPRRAGRLQDVHQVR